MMIEMHLNIKNFHDKIEVATVNTLIKLSQGLAFLVQSNIMWIEIIVNHQKLGYAHTDPSI